MNHRSEEDGAVTVTAANLTGSPSITNNVPSILRRVATIPYEGLLVLALLIVASFAVAGLLKGIRAYDAGTAPHAANQLYLGLVAAAYFVWFWTHGGQTLPMKTWRFKVVDRAGLPLTRARAIFRFLLALFFFGPAAVALVLLVFPKRISFVISMWGFLPMIATIWWAKFDVESQFLHDRLSGTRLINADEATKGSAKKI